MAHIKSKKLNKYIDAFRKYSNSMSVVNEHYRIELARVKSKDKNNYLDPLDSNTQIRDYHLKRSRKLFKKLVKLEIKLFGKRLL